MKEKEVLRIFNKTLEYANLDKNEVFLKNDILLNTKNNKENIYLEDEYIKVSEFEKSNNDHIYILSTDYNVFLTLNDEEIYKHFFNALSFIKTTYLASKGFYQGLTYFTLLKIAGFNDDNNLLNDYHDNLVHVYNEIDNVNKYVLIIQNLLMIEDDNYRFNVVFDLSFEDLSFDHFLFILLNEFYSLGVNFDSLISLLKLIFTYFNYKTFRNDEGYSLLLKHYDSDYYCPYHSSTINGYKFILLVDDYLTNVITFVDFRNRLIDYYLVLLNKIHEEANKKIITKNKYSYTSGDFKYEI